MTVAELIAALQALDRPGALVVTFDSEQGTWWTTGAVDSWTHAAAGPVVALYPDYSAGELE